MLIVKDMSGPDFTNSKAYFRMIHNISRGPITDVYVGDRQVASCLGYKSLTGYIEVEAGSEIIRFKISGTNIIFIEKRLSLMPGMCHTLFISGVNYNYPSLLIVMDDLLSPGLGKIKIRFVHVAFGIPELDLYVGNKHLFTKINYTRISPPVVQIMDPCTEKVYMTLLNKCLCIGSEKAFKFTEGSSYIIIPTGIYGDEITPLRMLIIENIDGMTFTYDL